MSPPVPPSASATGEAPAVVLPEGALKGRRLADGVLSYAAIPFAGPPCGPHRFRPPRPAPSWTGTLDATGFPPGPMQKGPASPEVSEDCLYLNLWTPAPEGNRPVLVWLYGGGFEGGSASPPWTNLSRLARRGMVVVAPNYRVGALGFAHLAGLGGPEWAPSANLGHQDQVAALQWVRARVAAFGGDPGNVTVAGQSAGGFSVGTLLAMPTARGLFHKAILASGSTGRLYSRDTADALARELISAVGVENLEQLVGVPADRIVEAQERVIDLDIGRRNTPGGRAWGTVLDGSVLPEDPQRAVERGAAISVPLLLGATNDEVKGFEVYARTFGEPARFVPPRAEPELRREMRRCVGPHADELLAAYRGERPAAGLADLRARFLSDWIYRIPAVRCASAQIRAGGSAWLYRFSYGLAELGGAVHGLDVPFLFDRLDAGLAARLAADPVACRVRDELVGAVVSFVETGDPGWPQHDPERGETTREFGGSSGLVDEPPPATRDIWPRIAART